ncbi:ABC transporter, ATP-binding protein [Ostertagia ostertagi]
MKVMTVTYMYFFIVLPKSCNSRIAAILRVVVVGICNSFFRYKIALLEARRAGILKNLFVGLSFGLMGLTNFSSFALAFYIGITWTVDGHLQLQDLMTTFFSVMMGSLALGQAGPQFAVLGAAQGAAASIFEVLDREPEIDSTSSKGRRDMRIKGNIEVKNVIFNYPSRPDIQITIDGVPISEINIEFLRNQIAVVSQEPILFNCTIEENIRFGRSDLSYQEIVAACRMANAEGFINGLPQGYQTTVGDRGTQLSGGQKQRIAIARALVRDPKILLLDEATSALDAESEAVVQRALEKASVGRTTIIIAHRLSTIKNADKIIAMRAGEVVEVGTHEELLSNKGLYYDLVHAQTFTDAVDDVNAHEHDEEFAAVSQKRASLISREISVQTANETQVSLEVRENSLFQVDQKKFTIQLKGNIITILTLEDQQIDDSKEKKDDITRLRQELKAEGVQKTNLFEILGYAAPHWKTIVVGLTACVIGGLVYPTYSVVFMQVITVS